MKQIENKDRLKSFSHLWHVFQFEGRLFVVSGRNNFKISWCDFVYYFCTEEINAYTRHIPSVPKQNPIKAPFRPQAQLFDAEIYAFFRN